MVRPSRFFPNPETRGSNAFQANDGDVADLERAQGEFDGAVHALRAAGVDVQVFEDVSGSPDAIFPNNWFSTHRDSFGSRVVLYPMLSEARRLERSNGVLNALRSQFFLDEILELQSAEADNRFLEGTGSMVLDRVHRLAYACKSPRTHGHLVQQWCEEMGYRPVMFDAQDESGTPLYHTNVMMMIGEGFACVASQAIAEDQREAVLQELSLERQVIDLAPWQLKHFCGNMLELRVPSGNSQTSRLLVVSSTAWNAFTEPQRETLQQYATPVVIDVPTIEQVGGGSIRCMIAENFLQPVRS